MHAPKIRIKGSSAVAVDPILSIDQLLDVSGKFSRIKNVEPLELVAALTTASGDLTASVVMSDTEYGVASEAAAVIVSAMEIAAAFGVRHAVLRQEIEDHIGRGVNNAIATHLKETLQARGAGEFFVR